VLGEWQSDPTGDLGRISRQQIFLRNALGKAKGRLSVTNVAELPDLIDVAVDHVTIDSGLSPNDLLNMMQRYAEFEGENIDTYTLPSEPYTTSGGAAVLQLDLAGAQPTLDIFRDESAGVVDVTSVDSIELTILNGSGVRRQAGEAQAALEDAGFVIIEVGDVFRPEGENLEATLIRYGPGAQEQAALVERHLAAGGELVFDELLVSGEIVLETGVDFTGVNRTPRPPPTASTVAGATSTSSTTSTTTTTVPVGRTPGEPPEGTECG